ncbi:MAG TPA: hypothetical protein VGB82_02195 [Alphaproteobacteria bacterium]
MNNIHRFAAAMLIALAPGAAFAQSGLADPAVPGSGSRIAEVHTTQAGRDLSQLADPAVPGSGARIAEVPATATRARNLSAEDANLAVPGDGYRIVNGAPSTAPASPAMNQNGTYPSRMNH